MPPWGVFLFAIKKGLSGVFGHALLAMILTTAILFVLQNALMIVKIGPDNLVRRMEEQGESLPAWDDPVEKVDFSRFHDRDQALRPEGQRH